MMKQRKIPMRTCIVTKEKCEKKDLIRIVKTPEGNIVVDLTGKMNGRGAYLKKEKEVFEIAEQKKVLDRVLETSIPAQLFEELNELVK